MQGRLPVTPAAWHKWLTYEKVSSDRPHQHDLVLVPDPAADLSSNSDKENQQPPAKSNTIHLLCLDCHGRFIISAHPKEGSDSRSCTKAGYMTHHFHLIGDNTEKCCGCELQLTLDFVPPVVPLSIIEEMSDTRKVNITYAAYTQQKQTGAAPTVSSALATMLIYIRDMLTGVRRNISVEKQSFKDRIGADNASIQLFAILGFTLDNMVLVSGLGTMPEDELLLRTVRQELEVTLANIRSPYGILSIPDQSIVPDFEAATAALNTFFDDQCERKKFESLASSIPLSAYDILGVVPDMADNVIIWAYNLSVHEQPKGHSQWLEALQKIAEDKKSEKLETEVAVEHSQGVYGVTDIRRAFEYFGVADSPNVDDDLILGLYDVKTTDEPANMKEHIDMLRVVANHRQSPQLLNMLSNIDGQAKSDKPNTESEKSNSVGATPTTLSTPTAEIAFSETKRVWQKATNKLKSEVSHAKHCLMEYSSFPPSSSSTSTCTSVNSIVASGHHIFMPGQIGMFPLPPAQQQLLVYDSPKPNDNNDDTVSYTSTSTTVTEKRSKRSNSTASIASLAVAKYSSAVNVISNAVTPAALAATTALASLSPSRSNMNSPVGLNNIGNTCYLNSLLQYYFTLKSLREPVLDMDNYVEHEEAPDWQEKRIGGIKVGRVEVGQAKQFVALLRELFLNLTHAQESSIAPQERLAFMALTSADEIAKSSMNVNLKPLLESREDVHSTDVMAKTDLEGVPEEDQPMATDGQEDNSVATESTANGDVAVVNEINTTESNVMKVEADETVTSTEESAQPVAEQPVSVQSVLEKPVPEAPLASAQPVAHEDFSTETPYENEHQASQLRSFPSTETLATTGSQATINETVDVTPVPERGPVPLPLPYSASEGNGKVTESTNPFESSVRPQDPTKMLFGRQQDVTECMGNCMYFFEAALRPVASESSPDVKTDLVKELFYGKARQILTYNNQDTDQLVTKIKEEEFSHLIVDAAEGKNLYDGLDEYFFADKVDDFQGGNCAVREVAVTHFPPILQIQVQRVQFDRSSARVYKSNAFVQFDETIYLDRYLDRNFEILADRRKRVTESRKQLEAYKADIAELNENKKYPMPVAEMLEVTTKILTDNQENSKLTNEDYERVLHILHEEILAIKSRISDRETKIANIIHEIRTKYDDFQDCKYRLHAVFIHQGQANYGHYWIYIRDHVGRKWWKYNDTNVSEVNESEIFKDTTGSTANPYFLVYVKASDVQKHVMTVCRKKLSQ